LPPRLRILGREVVLIALAAVTLYFLICLSSYSPDDPGWTYTGDPNGIDNLGGRFGALFSDLMLTGFGYSAYVLPVFFAMIGYRIFRRLNPDQIELHSRVMHGIGFVLTLMGAAGLEHLYFHGLSLGMPFAAGGVLGDLSSAWLASAFGLVGATVGFLVLFIAGISWSTDLSWFWIMDATGRGVFALAERVWGGVSWVTDSIAGARSRKRRQESVRTIRTELEKKAPPRIEPKFSEPRESERMTKERQKRLFEDRPVTGALPPLSLLDQPQSVAGGYSKESLEKMSRLLEKKLLDFNVVVNVVSVIPGPVITRFEIDPAPGVKASQIVGLSRDLARALSVVSVRVVENIPGKTVIGIEIPNEVRETVFLVEGLASEEYEASRSPLTLVLGKDIAGQAAISDLQRMPHVLIAGTTGSGKSVCINALILSILYKSTPTDVRLIMVDPKMLELSVYDGIPHLLAPVVTDMQKAANALRWCIVEMDRRFRLMAELGVRNIAGYNRKVAAAIKDGRPIFDPLAEPVDDGEEMPTLSTLPYIVVVVDELADLMMVVGKKIEELITRIAQRARASGIHLMLATQRPSVDVVTGLIKANVPTRIAFQVSSRADSRVVLDQMGAEQLLGHGDMLFLPPGTGYPVRVHGSFVSDQEVHQVVEMLKDSGTPEYIDEITEGDMTSGDFFGTGGESGGGESDPLYDQALRFVTESRRASISAVQRQLRVGYNRAARMIEAMEQAGVVGPAENGKRAVLAPPPAE
jgi:S-DNA-T family DNA segregation ATPase FtsK/SpoIIIE